MTESESREELKVFLLDCVHGPSKVEVDPRARRTALEDLALSDFDLIMDTLIGLNESDFVWKNSVPLDPSKWPREPDPTITHAYTFQMRRTGAYISFFRLVKTSKWMVKSLKRDDSKEWQATMLARRNQ